MSVSARSTKAALYSEIERLRSENDRLRNMVATQPAQRVVSPYRAKLEAAKSIAAKLGVTTRINKGDIEFFNPSARNWEPVSSGTSV